MKQLGKCEIDKIIDFKNYSYFTYDNSLKRILIFQRCKMKYIQSKKNQSWTVVKIVKTGFIQDYCNGRKETLTQNLAQFPIQQGSRNSESRRELGGLSIKKILRIWTQDNAGLVE